jgi:hypothetical protein
MIDSERVLDAMMLMVFMVLIPTGILTIVGLIILVPYILLIIPFFLFCYWIAPHLDKRDTQVDTTVDLTEGRYCKGGLNPPNTSTERPLPPKGSGMSREYL